MSTFIAIDGLDGSGKETQSNRLVNHLKIEGYTVRSLSFPVYSSESSALVRMYLDGKLGNRPRSLRVTAMRPLKAIGRTITTHSTR